MTIATAAATEPLTGTSSSSSKPHIVVTDVEEDWQDDDDDVSFTTAASSSSATEPASKKPKLLETTDQDKLRLLDGIATVQRQYLQREEPRVVFGTLLAKLLELTDSEYGFIGEVKYKEDGKRTPYLQTHAITNIAWNAVTRQFYDDNIDHGLKFYNLNSLFGRVIVTAEPMICNSPKDHPAACGVPEGHPPLDHFLGIPFFESTTLTGVDDHPKGPDQLVGMVGIANKPGGYTQADVDFLEPFVVTCSNLIQAYNAMRQNKELVETLEQRVQERTQELQKANESLGEANRKLEAASQAQLQTFASITHEIRTPLNCIIGLSSLLQETNLSPYQQDCLQMIVTSGDLLLTCVNDVLDYSKLETGNVEIAMRSSSLQTCLDAVVHSITQKARSKNLKVATTYDASVPEMIPMDNRRLQQILYNLLGNSVKFSPNEGTIELKVGLQENPYHPKYKEKERQQQQQVKPLFCIQGGTAPAATNPTNSPAAPDDDIGNGKPTEEAEPEQPTNKPQGGNDNDKASASSSKPAGGVDSGGGCPFHSGKETEPEQSSSPPKEQAQAQSSTSSSPGKSSGGCPFLSGKPTTTAPPKIPTMEEAAPSDDGEEDEDVLSEGLKTCDKILRFRVKDYGTGIPKKDFQRIFKPFKQANSMIETSHGGTGLGLAIVTKLVKGLGGHISVDSELGKWTEFSVDFPFTGKPFEVQPVAQELLQRAEIVSIERLQQGPHGQPNGQAGSDLLRGLGVRNVQTFHSMGSMIQTMSSSQQQSNSPRKDRFYLTLVDEKLHDATDHKRLLQLTKQKTAIISHGPNYSAKETNMHFRSLRQVLPSVLMRSLVNQIKASSQRGTEADNPEAAIPISYDRLRVLIAEDNKVNQKVLGRMLSRLGVTNVEFADNGQIAVDKNEQKEYDIIFMDMQMPVMDGLEATKLIVQHRGDKALPKVVFVTANVSEKFEEEASDAGGDGYISKPFSLGVIEKAFSRYL